MEFIHTQSHTHIHTHTHHNLKAFNVWNCIVYCGIWYWAEHVLVLVCWCVCFDHSAIRLNGVITELFQLLRRFHLSLSLFLRRLGKDLTHYISSYNNTGFCLLCRTWRWTPLNFHQRNAAMLRRMYVSVYGGTSAAGRDGWLKTLLPAGPYEVRMPRHVRLMFMRGSCE